MFAASRIVATSLRVIRGGTRNCTGAAATKTKEGDRVVLSNFDKKMMVWAKIYKTLGEVPESVSVPKMKRARDWFRIRLSIGMMLVTCVGCGAMVISGKSAHNHGESVEKHNKEWHEKVDAGLKAKPHVMK